MPVRTNIKYKDFLKIVAKLAIKNFGKYRIIPKSGSARRFELFTDEEDTIPCNMWVIHEDKYIYSDDLKKACTNLGVTKNEFEKLVKEL